MTNKTRRPIAALLFWGSAFIIVYTYIIFPILTILRGRVSPKPVRSAAGNSDAELPTVSLLIAAYNEADVIQAKLENSVALNYPEDRIEIIVVSDGSDDGTNDIVEAFDSPKVRLLALPRSGKNAALNQAVPLTNNEILVFTDADSMLEENSIRHLVPHFADPEVGGAAGDYHYEKTKKKGEGERAYWDFDRVMKKMQSASGSISSATGQIYAIRREIFEPVPSNVTDDAYISRTVIGKHKRLVFEPNAVARGPVADAAGEYRRKVRVTTRGLNCVRQQSHLLNPLEYGSYSWQLLSHKVLRRVMALPLLVLALTAPLLWASGWIYQLATLGQWFLHITAMVGWMGHDAKWGKSKFLSLPYHFDMVNVATLVAVKNLFEGTGFDVWSAERG